MMLCILSVKYLSCDLAWHIAEDGFSHFWSTCTHTLPLRSTEAIQSLLRWFRLPGKWFLKFWRKKYFPKNFRNFRDQHIFLKNTFLLRCFVQLPGPWCVHSSPAMGLEPSRNTQAVAGTSFGAILHVQCFYQNTSNIVKYAKIHKNPHFFLHHSVDANLIFLQMDWLYCSNVFGEPKTLPKLHHAPISGSIRQKFTHLSSSQILGQNVHISRFWRNVQ